MMSCVVVGDKTIERNRCERVTKPKRCLSIAESVHELSIRATPGGLWLNGIPPYPPPPHPPSSVEQLAGAAPIPRHYTPKRTVTPYADS